MKSALAIACASLCFLALSCGGGNARAGTYSVDTDAMIDSMLAEMPEGIGEEMKAMAREAMGQMKMEIILNSDQTYSGAFTMPGMPGVPAEESTSRGRWEMSGDTLTLRQTHEDGQEVADVQTGTFVGDSEFHLAGDGGQTLVMKKG